MSPVLWTHPPQSCWALSYTDYKLLWPMHSSALGPTFGSLTKCFIARVHPLVSWSFSVFPTVSCPLPGTFSPVPPLWPQPAPFSWLCFVLSYFYISAAQDWLETGGPWVPLMLMRPKKLKKVRYPETVNKKDGRKKRIIIINLTSGSLSIRNHYIIFIL